MAVFVICFFGDWPIPIGGQLGDKPCDHRRGNPLHLKRDEPGEEETLDQAREPGIDPLARPHPTYLVLS